MTHQKKILWFTTIMLLLSGTCACGQPRYHPGGPYYYKGWANYFLPFRPVDEISESEAKKAAHAYYVAYFYNNGLIKSFEKHYRGIRVFKTEYFYEDEKLVKEVSIEEDGKKTVWLWNADGVREKKP